MKKEVKVLVTTDISEESRLRIQETSEKIDLTVIPTSDPKNISDEIWAETEVLYTWNVLPDPSKAPKIRWVQFNSAGVDSFVDHDLICNPEVMATNMSGVINSQIAEYVLMAMLAFGQKLPHLFHYQREKKWPKGKEKWENLLPLELRYSTVGILGYGSIGRQVARLLQPFGATVLAAKKDV